MFTIRIAATFVALAIAVPAFAQEAAPAPNSGDVVATAPDVSAEGQATAATAAVIPQLPRVTFVPEGNPFKLSAGDFKRFFRADTGRTLAYVAIVAIASAP